MKTYFDAVYPALIACLAFEHTPPKLAAMARSRVHDKCIATELCLASIRAQGNWLQINGHWHRRAPYLA